MPPPRHPLAAALLEFNLLPSRSLHPSRASMLAAAPERLCAHPRTRRALHRQWSADLLASLGAAGREPAGLGEAALPLALAAPPLQQALARQCGIVLLAAPLRHAIRRSDVLAAQNALGADGLALARATELHAGVAAPDDWVAAQGGDLAAACDLLGAGLMAQAWSDGADALRLRADLKLIAACETPAVRQASGLDPAAARALCLQLLARLEPAWFSLFPNSATR